MPKQGVPHLLCQDPKYLPHSPFKGGQDYENKSILLAYATRYGSTQGFAEAIATELRQTREAIPSDTV